MRHHLRYMVVGGGLVLALLLALKVDLRTALPYALLLACPLGMAGMMFMMNRQGGQGGQGGHGGHGHGGDQDHCSGREHGPTSDDADTFLRPGDPGSNVDRPLTRENHERLP